MIEIIISILIGCLLGTITGLTPGIHMNLVAAVILLISQNLLKYTSDISILVIIVVMAITHLFLDTIPSIFLGVPSPDSSVIILPAHKLLLEGKAQEAIYLTLVGLIFSILFFVSLIPFLIKLLSKLQLIIKDHIHIILIISILLLIIKEKQRLSTLIVFLLSGVLGIIVLNIPNIKEPLLPLLSGLFGLSSLLLSIKNNTIIPVQNNIKTGFEIKKLKFIFIGLTSGIISAFLPGLGSSQVSVLTSSFIRKIESKDYLILNSSINTINLICSFITLYTINKARNGIAIVISKLIQLTLDKLILITSVILIATFTSTLLTIFFSNIFLKLITKINYKKLCLIIIVFVTILVIVISKPIGFIILIASTSLGIYAQLKEVNKNHLMGCLTIPVILYFIL